MREYHYTDRFDYGQDLYPSSDKEMRVVFFGMIGTFVLLHYFCNNFFARHDEALPKQFPFTYEGHGTYWHKSNIKRNIHYTFEPAEPAEGSEWRDSGDYLRVPQYYSGTLLRVTVKKFNSDVV